MLTVDVGELRSGQTVTIILTAKVRDEADPAVVITNRASLLYTGHVAVQTPTAAITIRR